MRTRQRGCCTCLSEPPAEAPVRWPVVGGGLVVRRNAVLVTLVGLLALTPAAPAFAAEEPPTMAFVGDSIGHRSEASDPG